MNSNSKHGVYHVLTKEMRKVALEAIRNRTDEIAAKAHDLARLLEFSETVIGCIAPPAFSETCLAFRPIFQTIGDAAAKGDRKRLRGYMNEFPLVAAIIAHIANEIAGRRSGVTVVPLSATANAGMTQ